MNAFDVTIQLFFALQVVSLVNFTIGGTCWSTMVNNGSGRCTELIQEKITLEDCCSGRSVTTAWSSEEMDSGTLFFWRILGGGVQCVPCKNSCNEVVCNTNKTCVIRKGTPKCVCSSRCKEGKTRHRGPVCGTDGRSYHSICRLKKRACRRRSSTLSVDYQGVCQKSCDKVKCPIGKHCLLDQNLKPHCVLCNRKCSKSVNMRPVCGSDGNTYPSVCHLREKACRKGRAIPIAYKGPCKANATCNKVQCRDSQSCLKDLATGMPRCVNCNDSCRPRHMHGPICGTNNNTYHTWCHMMKDACFKGFVIETAYFGKCLRNKNS